MTRPVQEREEICRLWIEGKSAKEISEKIGAGLSRNAVIGIVFRAGLTRGSPQGPSRYIAPKRKPEARRKRPSRVIVVGDTVFSADTPRPARAVAREAAFLPLPGSTPRHLTDRPPGACCWPVGEEFLSCCEATQNHKYCPEHRALSMAQTQPKHPNQPPMMRSFAREAA